MDMRTTLRLWLPLACVSLSFTACDCTGTGEGRGGEGRGEGERKEREGRGGGEGKGGKEERGKGGRLLFLLVSGPLSGKHRCRVVSFTVSPLRVEVICVLNHKRVFEDQLNVRVRNTFCNVVGVATC